MSTVLQTESDRQASGPWRRPAWDRAEPYDFTGSLDAGQWAWEFLRRNQDYERDWQWFRKTWQSLEERYGKPPDRDFQRWKRDPDAWMRVDDAAGECSVDQDKVLIECWMGAKWGFYKFPLSPATDCPLIGEQLLWRERQQPLHRISDGDVDYLGRQPQRIALGFDLDLPLRAQIETAKRFLQVRQARLRREGQLQMKTVANLRSRWRCMLRLLDAGYAGVRGQELCTAFGSTVAELSPATDVQTLLTEARQLVAREYRELPALPES